MEVIAKQDKKKSHREQHRDRYEIVNDILRFIASKYNCNIAEVTFGASLSYNQQKRYLGHLINRGLILISSEANSKAMKLVHWVGNIWRYSQN